VTGAGTRWRLLALLAAAFVALASGGCGEEAAPAGPYPVEVEPTPGVAVALLIDTSGSMGETVAGDREPKHRVARAAATRMLDATEALLRERPGLAVEVAVIAFAADARTILPMRPYDPAGVRAALASVEDPEGSTALGSALEEARRQLYRSGCLRKYVLAVTDGQNTVGPEPEAVAREIRHRSEGAVTVYFVAFDTDPRRFGFLRDLGGDVLAARNASDLDEVLRSVYEGRILAEAMEGEGAR
jgi:Mg-chelatase subunit ChlD